MCNRAQSPQNWTSEDRGATWFHGTDAPKKAAIEAGLASSHQVFLEQVTSRGRRFGSFASLSAMTAAFGTDNAHLFEILVPDRPVKCYLDIEYVGEDEELFNILDKLQTSYQQTLNMQLSSNTIRISCATGQGEHGSYKGKQKQSYHVIIDNGFAFKSVQHVRDFVSHAFADDDRVDKAVYGRNQSFKMIHQSKLNSNRVQKPTDGHSYLQHMVSIFASPPSLHSIDNLHHAVERSTRLQITMPEPLRVEEHVYVTDEVDIHSVNCLLSYFPNGPTKEAKQPFSVYLAVACICVNENEPYDVFATWASKYKAWSPSKSQRIWKTLSRRLDGYDIRTLRAMLHKARPSVLKNIQTKIIDQVTNPTLDLAANGYDCVQYSEPLMEPFIDQALAYKHVAIRYF